MNLHEETLSGFFMTQRSMSKEVGQKVRVKHKKKGVQFGVQLFHHRHMVRSVLFVSDFLGSLGLWSFKPQTNHNGLFSKILLSFHQVNYG
jgi:hypothetical protein